MRCKALYTTQRKNSSRRDFRRYTEAQPDLGVPCLMHVSPAGDVPLDGEDLALVTQAEGYAVRFWLVDAWGALMNRLRP